MPILICGDEPNRELPEDELAEYRMNQDTFDRMQWIGRFPVVPLRDEDDSGQ